MYKTVADRFDYLYNSEKYDSDFALFSNEMKTALPIDKTKDFLSGLKTQVGNISKMQFVKYENGTYAKGNSYRTDGTTNEDYYAFGKELIAPCDGEVVLAVDGVKDNKPGEMNPVWVPGNTVIIRTANNEYLFLAHFKQHSILVKEGQKVNKGTILGQCGNSGNSSEPHLHFHLQNVENMIVATGIKCYFDTLLVNGQSKTDYFPVKTEKLSRQ